MTEAKKTKEKKAERPTRKPLYRSRLLEFEAREGFERRLVNDEVGAIKAFKEAGWTPVLDTDADQSDERIQEASPMGRPVRRVVNKDPNASAHYGILMEIPKELYEEDQKAKQRDREAHQALWDPDILKQRDPKNFY